MATTPDARRAGMFEVGGTISVARLGFGAMRVTGAGVWGEPADRAEAIRTLKRLPDLGVTFVDTADSYGPDISEELIGETLRPYGDMLVATKGGLTRTGPNVWIPVGRPEYLIQQALKSRRRLGVDRIELWQLHRVDPKVPRAEQFDAVKTLIDQGVIAHAGLSNVSVDDIEAARKVFPVATVQNRYNLVDRTSEDVLDYCERHGIGFVPWYPLAAGDLAKPGSLLDKVAHAHDRHAESDRARVGAEAQPRDAADPRYRKGEAPRGQRCRRGHQVVGRGFCRARSGRQSSVRKG